MNYQVYLGIIELTDLCSHQGNNDFAQIHLQEHFLKWDFIDLRKFL